MPQTALKLSEKITPERTAAAVCILAAVVIAIASPGLEAVAGAAGYAAARLAAPAAYFGCRALFGLRGKPQENTSRRMSAAALLAFAAVYLLYYYIGILFGNIFSGFDMFAIGGMRTYMSAPTVMALLLYALVPAVCEVQLLRLCAALKTSGAYALILPAVAFALLHFHDGMPGWGLLGAALACIYYRTGRLSFCIPAHFFVNAVTILLAHMNESFSVSSGSRIDFAMKSGMNGLLLAGFGMTAGAVSFVLLAAAAGLSGKKFTAAELAIIAVLTITALITGGALTAAGNA